MKYVYMVHDWDGFHFFTSMARAINYCVRHGYHVQGVKTHYANELKDIYNNVATIYKEVLNCE